MAKIVSSLALVVPSTPLEAQKVVNTKEPCYNDITTMKAMTSMEEGVAKTLDNVIDINQISEVEGENRSGSREHNVVPANSSNDCVMIDQPIHYENEYDNHLYGFSGIQVLGKGASKEGLDLVELGRQMCHKKEAQLMEKRDSPKSHVGIKPQSIEVNPRRIDEVTRGLSKGEANIQLSLDPLRKETKRRTSEEESMESFRIRLYESQEHIRGRITELTTRCV